MVVVLAMMMIVVVVVDWYYGGGRRVLATCHPRIPAMCPSIPSNSKSPDRSFLMTISPVPVVVVVVVVVVVLRKGVLGTAPPTRRRGKGPDPPN